MQFKHPEILWALFLLIIPIIIHLFHLRKFQEIPFTNVEFLKQINLKTRKSSQLKKWLVLLARLLAFASIIIAFAQPYFANRNIEITKEETTIYLDNSFSMQLQGSEGELLPRAVNQLIENIPENEVFSLFTNTKSYKSIKISDIKNELLSTPYTAEQLDFNEILLKGNSLFSDKNAIHNFIIVSDFQQRKSVTFPEENTTPYLVKLSPATKNNIAIDSVFISKKDLSNYNLEVRVSNNYELNNIPIALHNDTQLIAKTAATFEGNQGKASFSIPKETIKGTISLDDNGLQYDNTLFFSINKEDKINVLSINESDDNFLRKIYTEDEFNYTSTNSKATDFNSIQQQNIIILNEVNTISNALKTALIDASKRGISIIIILGNDISIPSYNQFLGSFNNTSLVSFDKEDVKQITDISFDHPLFANVFEERVTNFQYPTTKASYSLSGNYTSVIKYANNTSFLAETNNIYLFNAPLNKENSNFQSSPLIVPAFYNMAKHSLALPNLYFTIGTSNTFDIKAQLENDEIVTIANKNESFIPLQQTYNNRVSITTKELPTNAGIYNITKGNLPLIDVSFNYNRSESLLNYLDISTIVNNNNFSSVADAFKNVKSKNNVDELWKWFVIFALIFLCIEMLILKYFK
ncbi:BatA domain-containing protein [Joostella sp.]|uniref:BatA domain-containing protein n=1 Tax=Joostella sp. TaxID=2231138 RepID=UPI003A903298